MKSLNCTKLGYTSITCSKISNIPYIWIFTTKFNDSLILITIISSDYFNLSLVNEYVGNVTKPTQVIKYNQNCLQANQPIRLQYSNKINLLNNVIIIKTKDNLPQFWLFCLKWLCLLPQYHFLCYYFTW